MLTNVQYTGVKYNQENKQEHRIGLKQNKNALKGLNPDDIPNIAPAAAISEFMKGDENPYYKLQAISYPIKANGYIYLESFFESFLKNLKDHPFPGSKYGHETSWMKRDKTDLILIGGKIESKGNGKGTVFLKNYIPPVGDNGDNTIFIKELKAGMIEFSLVSYTRDEWIEKPSGETVRNVVESLYGERNDAVPINEGAMEQKVSKKDDNNPGGAGDDNLNEENIMQTKTELLAMLPDLKKNSISLEEVAGVLGEESKLITDKHISALNTIQELEKLNCQDPVKEIQELRATIKQNQDVFLKNKLDEAFGIDEDNKNLLRQYAEKQIQAAEGNTIDEKINSIKNDPVAEALAGNKADYKKNQIKVIDKPGDNQNKENDYPVDIMAGIPVVES